MSVVEIMPGSGISAKYLALQEDELGCPICFEVYTKKDFSDKTIHMTACQHFFHTECLERCKNPQICPSCNQHIDTEGQKERWAKIVSKIQISEPAKEIPSTRDTAEHPAPSEKEPSFLKKFLITGYNFIAPQKSVEPLVCIVIPDEKSPDCSEDELLAIRLQAEEDKLYAEQKKNQEEEDRKLAEQLQNQ